MFMALDDNDLKVVIDAMDEKKVVPGEFVIKEGDDGDVLFIVESGELNCTKVIDGASKFLKHFEQFPHPMGSVQIRKNNARKDPEKTEVKMILTVGNSPVFRQTFFLKKENNEKLAV